MTHVSSRRDVAITALYFSVLKVKLFQIELHISASLSRETKSESAITNKI
jgi:hypothetical protein